MRDRGPYLGGLLDLPQLETDADRRAVWRQTLVLLARGGGGPGPLEGLHPDAVLAAVRVALATGLVDDLDWLAEPAAGAALYEIAAVVPPSVEQRELGRRVLARLLQGGADTFVAIATRMALGTGKGLSAPHVRARIALVAELPIGVPCADGPLCLALVARRQLARDFVVGPSTASLPARRSAALILERAAREAASRAQQGDDHAMRAFASEGVAQAFERLLADREPLVWRHAAAARGMLVPWNAAMRAAVQAGVDPKLSPTEWRRAATSITALLSVDPEQSGRLVKQWLGDGGPAARDPGGAAALVWGLGRAAEAEPDAAADLLAKLVQRMPIAIAEAVADLAANWGATGPFEHSIGKIALAIRNHAARDEGEEALHREILRELERVPRSRASRPDVEVRADDPLDAKVPRALATFATEGARAAYAFAQTALDDVHGLLDALEAADDPNRSAVARRTSLSVLRQLDHALLERSTLADLLHLAPSPDAAKAHEEALAAARERIAAWVLERFRRDEGEDAAGAQPTDVALRLRHLRALLHLVDSDLGEDDPARAAALRKRWSTIAGVLVRRMERGLAPALRRANAAALSRTLDALVRAEALDPADALLAIARRVSDPAELGVLAEASMDPSLRHALARYADLARSVAEARQGEPAAALGAQLAALERWTSDGLLDPSNRAEALRTVVVRMHHAASAIGSAGSLDALSTTGGADVVAAFETSLGSLGQLTAGARARLDADAASPAQAHVPVLAVGVARVLSGALPELGASVRDAAHAAAREAPAAFEAIAAGAIDALARLPAREDGRRSLGGTRMAEALPSWLPPRRTLGGFYVQRPLASGGGGSVLVAVRIEERQESNAERFALKVPSYDASAARSVSEAEFFEMFRAEAGALIAVPQHPNLARFVTFDTGSKPKPILVMELVEGHNLEHEIASGALDVPRALALLDGVLAGLEAMHGVEVGHLDLKPSNVVLRGGRDPVLVDFGLAGRRVRPGCATGPYGAPEVWSGAPDASPLAADVYAFGCVAYEALTGDVLFRADSELTQITMHLAHDGFPEKLRALAGSPALQPLAELLFATLRRDPRNRPNAARVRAELKKLAPSLVRSTWPIVRPSV